MVDVYQRDRSSPVMKKSELLKIIKEELGNGSNPGVERVLDLLDVLIYQGGATRGDVEHIKKVLEEKK